MADSIAVLSLLIGLELVLGVDNILVIVSFVALLFFAKPIGEYILKRPALKILALSFLITIGVTIFLEGMHQHVPKGYIYLPMGFALMVELLQMRHQQN